jgi:hypothetical protein
MAKGFQLTAELNLRGPSNIRQVVGGIRKQLQGINTNLNININKKNIQGMQQANTRLAAINKTLQTTVKNANNATAAFNKLSASMRSVGNVKISPNIASGMNNTTKSVVTTTKAVQQAKNEFEEFGKLGGLAIKRFAAFSVVTGAIYAVNNAITASVKSFLEYDRQLTRVSQVLDTNRTSLRGLDQSITALSTSLGVSSTELANVTVTLSQAGIQAADTRKALEALAKSALAPTFASLTNTTEGAIAAMRQFSISAGELEGALGSINAVAGKFAVEASDIITAIQRTGGVFASASKGVSQGTAALNEFIAVFTSVRATSRESAETIATGLRTIFTRLQRQDTIDALKQFGVTLTDLEGKFVGPYKAIQLLSEGLRSLDTRDLKFAGIAEELGGFRQIGKVLPLIQQFGTAQQALNVAQGGSGSLAKDAAKGQLALAVQIQKVREEFTALVRSISDSTGFRTLLTVGLDLSRVFIGVADALKGVLPLLAGLGAMKGLSALAGFTKGFGGVFKKAEGGYIHKFARGGTVPGTGSGDTVPAMLQPGEFVIRKKAVQTLGTQRLHNMNKFGNGGKQKAPAESPTTLPATGGTEFTHLSLSKVAQTAKGQNVRLYNNMGLDLPKSWNRNWGLADGRVIDNWGAYASDLANYIRTKDVFKTLKSGQSKYRFVDRQKGVKGPQDILRGKGNSIKGTLATLVETQAGSFLDNDFQVGQVLPRLVRQAISSTEGMTQKDSRSLRAGMRQTSAMKLDGDKGRRKTTKSFRQQMGLYAQGGSVDTVPAMLTPGEFVINKSSASKLGTRTLNKLNNADRIKGYNRGGFVGFANGGQAQARPGDTFDTIGISRSDISIIGDVAKEVKELGIASSATAKLLEQGKQVSYETALEALEADKFRAKSIGASTKSIDANIKALKKQAEGAQKVSQALKGASGEQLQNLSNRLDRGQKVGRAATRSGLGDVAALAKSGDIETKDIQAYIAQASRDRKTLNQMDKFQINERKNYHLKQNKSLKDATRLAKQEVAERRKIIDQVARSEGARGPGDFGRGLGKISNQLGIGVSLLSSAASSLEATSAGGAGFNAGLQGGGLAFGAGQIATGAVVDVLPEKYKSLGAGLGLAASAALAAGQAFISSSNAIRQFKIDKSFEKANTAMEAVNESLKELEKNANDVNIKAVLEDKLIEAGNSVAKGLDIQNNSAKLFWANAIDVVLNAGTQEAVARSQILEAQGLFAYMRSVFDASFRSNAVEEMSGDRVSATVKQFKPVADGILKLTERQLQAGSSVADILGEANFKDFADSLALADRETARYIDSIATNTSMSQAEKDARISHIKTIAAEEAIRKQGAIVAQQKQIQALQRSTSIYTRSLERMFRNMEQAINKASASLDKMNNQIGLTIAAMQGEARVGDSSLDALTILENPRAFSAAENRQATQRGTRSFGDNAANVESLVNVGERIENSVMSSVNSVLSSNPGATNAAVERQIVADVGTALDNLGLPPDLADKLAGEVKNALADLSSEGQNTVDYAKLAEKLGNLNSVIETSTRAREVVIKLLQHQQKAASSYTANLNKILDIEVRSRQKARKAIDILADGELNLAKALGKTISVLDVINSREANIGRQTGGLKTVNDIFNRINELAAKRLTQQGAADASFNQGDTDNFVKFSNSVADTNLQLRENIAALKDLASNGSIAASALEKIQEAQKNNAQKVGFFEKVVTSTPDELEGMNSAFIRLQRNLNGQINTINQSVGAQKAYFEALKSGASQFEAMRAAQGAFAQERGESLSLLKDIMPFLGDSQQAGGIRATALESMLRESGAGINPMMQEVLNGLRNPEGDPAIQASINLYKQGNSLQAQANKSLGNLDSQLANNVASQNEQAFKSALAAVPVTFKNTELADIRDNVSTITNIMKENRGAQGLANGGVVYAAGGQQIFQPKGTDTVPAMLTPGEFVVNRQATQANLPLLKNINNGYYARGGLVSYWNRNEPITPQSDVGSESKKSYLDFEFIKNFQSLVSNNNPWMTLPSTYYSTTSSTAQSPIRGASTEQAYDPSITNFDKLKYTGGKNEVGFVQDIFRNRQRIGPAILGGFIGARMSRSEYTDLDTNRARMNIKVNPVNGRLLDSTDTINSRLKPIPYSDYEDYEKAKSTLDLTKLYNPAQFNDLDNVKEKSPTGGGSGDTLSNTGMGFGSFGFSRGPMTLSSVEQDGLFKIHRDSTSELGHNSPFDAVSTRTPSFNGTFKNAGYYAGFGESPRKFERVDITGDRIDPNNPNHYMVGSPNFDNLTKSHNLAYQGIKDIMNDFPLTDDDFGASGRAAGAGTYRKLFNLYNGQSAFEEFSGSQIKALKNANAFSPGTGTEASFGNLIVAGAAKLQQDILDRATELQALLVNQPNLDIKEFGIFGSQSLRNSRGVKDTGFDIGLEGAGEGARKYFNWAANIPAAKISQAFKQAEEEMEDAAKGSDGVNRFENLSPENIKLPYGDFGLDLVTRYQKYVGKFYDPKKFDFTEQAIDTFLPLKGTGTNPIQLFNNAPLATEISQIGLANKLKPGEIKAGLNIKAGVIQKYRDSLQTGTADKNLENQISNATLSMGPLLQQLQNQQGIPKFIAQINKNRELSVGSQLIESIKRSADLSGQSASQIFEGDRFVKGEGVDNDLLPQTTKGLTKAALQLFSRYNFVRGVSQFLGRSIGGIPNNDNIDTAEKAMGAARIASNAFGQVGGTADKAFGKARNNQMAQFIKSAYILASGAWQAFGGIAGGDTALLQDFVSAAGPDGELSPAYAEGLFRSLGGGAALQAVANFKLPNEYQNLTKNLQGGKIATIGPNGGLAYEDMANVVPEDVQGLLNLILNPYNEFPTRDVRASLIEKFQNDLARLKDSSGKRSFFDPQTSGFINEGLNRLRTWYGGADPWVGQDYLHDTNFENNIAERAKKITDTFATSNYSEAQEANAAFGLNNKFGSLPDANWFLAKGRAVTTEQQNKARGGIIYASEGQMINFQPKGTDTVPAMLTPGEFVVNRQATQQNLPLLKSINRSQGGPVYFDKGGLFPETTSNFSPYSDLKPKARVQEEKKKIEEDPPYPGAFEDKKRQYYITRGDSEEQIAKYDAYKKQQAIDNGWLATANKAVQQGLGKVKNFAAMAQKTATGFAGNMLAGMTTAMATSAMTRGATAQGTEETNITAEQTGSAKSEAEKNAEAVGVKPQTSSAPKRVRETDKLEAERRAEQQERDRKFEEKEKRMMAEKADREAKEVMYKKRLALVGRLNSRFDMMIAREDAEIKQQSQARDDAGFWYNSIKPMLGGGDTQFAPAIKAAKNKRGTAVYAKSLVEKFVQSQDVSFLKQAAGIAGFDVEDGALQSRIRETRDAEGNLQIEGLAASQRTDAADNARMLEDTEKGITSAAQNTADAVMIAGAGVGGLASSGAKVTQVGAKQVAKAVGGALLESVGTQGVLEAEKVSSGRQTVGQGLTNTAIQGTTSVLMPLAGRAAGKLVGKAGGEAAEVGKRVAGDMAESAKQADAVLNQRVGSFEKYLDGIRAKATKAGLGDEVDFQIEAAMANGNLNQGFVDEVNSRLARQATFDQATTKFGRELQYDSFDSNVQKRVIKGWKDAKTAGTANDQTRDRLLEFGQMQMDRNAMIARDASSAATKASSAADAGTAGLPEPDLKSLLDFSNIPEGTRMVPSQSSWYNPRELFSRFKGVVSATGDAADTSSDKQATGLFSTIFGGKGSGRRKVTGVIGTGLGLASIAMPHVRKEDSEYKARGGLIYANEGMMIPRGTDTVPAMLTPGEFVVNRQASQKNLGLLKSINSGVSYFKNGGEAEKGTFDQKKADKAAAKDEEEKRLRRMKEQEKAASAQAKDIAREKQIPLQQAYQQALQEIRSADQLTSASSGAASPRSPGGASNSQAQMPQISRQQQAMTAQASQAAFNPKNSGDVNKQLAIFGQVLTGVNQVLVQYGTVLQNLVGVQQQLMGGGGGGQRQGDSGGVSNGNGGLAEYTQKFGEFVQSLKGLNIPESINLNAQHTVNVNFAGGEQLGKALDEGNAIANFVIGTVEEKLANWVNSEMPGTSPPKIK